MSPRIRRVLAIVIVTIATLPTLAQDINVKLGMKDGTAAVTEPGILKENDVTSVSSGKHTVKVECADADACKKSPGVKFAGASPCIFSSNVCSGEITVDATSPSKLVIESNGKSIFSTTLSAAIKAPASDTDKRTTKTALTTLLQTPCNISYSGATYDRATDQAVFVTDVLGNVKFAPTENVDENDKIKVILWADTRLHPFLHVFRKSAIRQLGSVNLAGSGVTVTLPADSRQALNDEGRCAPIEFMLTAFAAGKGEVQIDAQVDQTQTLGGFEFLVDKLYDGILSAGTTRSNISDRAFKLTKQGDKNIIYSTEEDGSNEYAVFLSAFLRQRDLEKPAQGPLDFIAPAIGVSMKHPGDHAYIGLSLNWRLIVFTAGQHFAHVTTLSKASGLHEGDAFAGTEAEIPSAKKWKSGRFYAVTMDLRAITQLFSALGGGAAK